LNEKKRFSEIIQIICKLLSIKWKLVKICWSERLDKGQGEVNFLAVSMSRGVFFLNNDPHRILLFLLFDFNLLMLHTNTIKEFFNWNLCFSTSKQPPETRSWDEMKKNLSLYIEWIPASGKKMSKNTFKCVNGYYSIF
jgi:hypothetical protein